MVLDLAPLPPVSVIPWKVEEVFLNLLSNAIEAMPGGGEIRIESRALKDALRIEIADNGPGIAETDLPYVIDPFFTTKEIGQGTGLGLSICFGIMKMHGGSLEVHSHQGQGTKVSLFFPTGEEADVQNSDC